MSLYTNIFRLDSNKAARVCMVLAVLSTCFFAWKLTFVSADEKERIRLARPQEIFNDDGGVYIALVSVMGEGDRMRSKAWFKEIAAIPEEGFLRSWGAGSTRNAPIFRTNPCPLWTVYLVGLSRITGTYKSAFRLSIALFPFFLLCSLLLIYVYFRRLNKLWVVSASAVFLILLEVYSHNHYWYTSSTYAWILFLPGVMIWAFGRRKPIDLAGAFFLMGLSALTHTVALVVTMLIVLLTLVEEFAEPLWTRVSDYVARRFHVTLQIIVLAMLTVELSWRPLMAFFPTAIERWWMPNRYFIVSAYLEPSFLLLIVVSSWVMRSVAEPTPSMRRLSLATVGICAGIFCISILGPFLPLNASQNTGRLAEHFYLFLVTGLIAAYRAKPSMGDEAVRFSQYAVGAVLVLVALSRAYPSATHLMQKEGHVASILPRLVEKPGYPKFFLASNTSELISYFLHERYKDTPLVLNVRTPEYSPGRAMEVIRREGPYAW